MNNPKFAGDEEPNAFEGIGDDENMTPLEQWESIVFHTTSLFIQLAKATQKAMTAAFAAEEEG